MLLIPALLIGAHIHAGEQDLIAHGGREGGGHEEGRGNGHHEDHRNDTNRHDDNYNRNDNHKHDDYRHDDYRHDNSTLNKKTMWEIVDCFKSRHGRGPTDEELHQLFEHGHTHEHLDHPGLFSTREPIIKRNYKERAFTVGIGGPVGSG